MLMRKMLFVLGMLIFLGQSLHAQERTITGKVISSDNAPVAGATVSVRSSSGKGESVAASADGTYRVRVPNTGSYTLIISAVGYDNLEVPSSAVGAGSTYTATLKGNAKGLNEVVVVGYGTAKKKDLTGAVATVSLTNSDQTPVLGATQLLEGTVAGVQVTQYNSQPGAAFSVRIRGTNSISYSSDPLYVLDGYAGADLTGLNATDIQSIDILKDASAAAIYGSRGANGVVLITTKKGVAGKPAVSFDMYTGEQQVARRLKMMNGTQFATYLNQIATFNNTAKPYTDAQIAKIGAGTDWQKAIYRTAPMSNYFINVSGGSDNNHYYLSANYFDQQGVLINTGYKRGTVRFNMDSKISDKVRAGINSAVTYAWTARSDVNSNGGSTSGTILNALRFNPALPIRDSAGNFTFQDGPLPYTDQMGNPVAQATQNTDRQYDIRTLLNAFVEYEIIPGLRLRSTIGGELYNGREEIFKPTTSYLAPAGQAQVNTNNNYNYLNENTITFDKTMGIHAINVVAGWTYQLWKNKSANASATSLSSNAYGTDNLSVGSASSVTSNTNKNNLASGLMRVNYRLMDKYIFTFNMRADGSSRFGVNKKWGYFPSGAFAWRASDEKFIQNISAISELKVRLSYGLTGNQEIPDYLSLPQYSTNTYYLDGARVVGISPNNIANADLAWEQTASTDAGIDLGLFNNTLQFTGDYYNKKTTKLLYTVSLPSTSGFTTMIQNIGAVRNQGFEFAITSTNINKKGLRWTTTVNFSRNLNKILSLGSVPYQYTGNVSTSLFPSGGQASAILKVGQPFGSFYGYKFLGIWQSADEIAKSGTKQAVKPGDPHYADLNADGQVNASDRMIIGHALPKFTAGFSSDLRVGAFNLYVLIQGVYGDNILNENKIEMENGTTGDNKFAYVATDSWVPGAVNNNRLPIVTSTVRRGLGVTSDIMEDGSYARLKTVTLSYDVPLPKLTGGVFKKATVYITGQNLLTLTHYSGYDPEVNSYGNSNGNYSSLNTDYNPYPNVRSYMAGIKLGF
ncbi:TonB-dependent receptor [Puia sp.]|uniref:SusC/RagA family TonB-linked outer membrane protein n=1 Tax=Puia sp. TaxID=2045100 RepID=UPI002F3F1B5D